MPLSTSVFELAGVACAVVALTVIAFLFARVRAMPAPDRGLRGLARVDALASGGFFATVEPLIRMLAGRIVLFDLRGLHSRLALRLRRGGDFLGLAPEEFIALMVVGSICGGLSSWGFAEYAGYGGAVVVAGAVVGGMLPSIHLNQQTQLRYRDVNRGLPGAIDLAAMAMGAGLDFPGALRQVVGTAPRGGKSPLLYELANVLQKLELGRTRQQALVEFADRVPTDAVREFVAAVVQAEEKGTPLSQVLSIQAQMLRLRRSVLAEESAAKAGVKMMIPLMMVFGTVFIVLLGPMIVQVAHGGL